MQHAVKFTLIDIAKVSCFVKSRGWDGIFAPVSMRHQTGSVKFGASKTFGVAYVAAPVCPLSVNHNMTGIRMRM